MSWLILQHVSATQAEQSCGRKSAPGSQPFRQDKSIRNSPPASAERRDDGSVQDGFCPIGPRPRRRNGRRPLGANIAPARRALSGGAADGTGGEVVVGTDEGRDVGFDRDQRVGGAVSHREQQPTRVGPGSTGQINFKGHNLR